MSHPSPAPIHRKAYDPRKLRIESQLGAWSAPWMTRAFSYSPRVPLGSAVARAERETRVARSLREVAARFDIDVIEPDPNAPDAEVWTREVEGENLVDVLRNGRATPGLEGALERLGRLHAFLAERWHSLGDVSWANVIVSFEDGRARLTLCDFEHARWPQHAGFDDPACRTPPAGSCDPHWPIDDLYEGFVTTACKLPVEVSVDALVRAYARGLAAGSRTVAYAVARLFPLRLGASRLRVGTSQAVESGAKQYLDQLACHYDVMARAVADAVELPAQLRTLTPRPRAIVQRTLGWLMGDEYGWDAVAYHDYARAFEDRDGVAARALLSLEALRGEGFDVLDVGAGTGLIGGTAALCHPSWRVTLLDPSEPQLDQARACYGERVTFVQAPMERARLVENTFDRILMASAIRYCPDPSAAASEMKRALKPDGLIVVLPTDFSGDNDVLYASLGLRSAASVESFFESQGFVSVGPHWALHVRRGFAERPLVFAHS